MRSAAQLEYALSEIRSYHFACSVGPKLDGCPNTRSLVSTQWPWAKNLRRMNVYLAASQHHFGEAEYKTAAMAPMMMAAHEWTTVHPAEIETRPATTPLQTADTLNVREPKPCHVRTQKMSPNAQALRITCDFAAAPANACEPCRAARY